MFTLKMAGGFLFVFEVVIYESVFVELGIWKRKSYAT